ncbi:MAG TPA: HEAT repeat domain-containing protein [Vicinamibacterales bacterium]|nr:HEAT repeat domain-containing protein [Vicinamibacterales bacterium]
MKTRVMWKGIMAMAGAVVLSAVPVIAQPGAKAPKPGAVPGEIPGGEFALPPGTGALERPGAPIDWSEQREDREQERARETRQRERELYESGIEALDDDRFDRALERFNRVIEMNGSNVDGAKYWKAYAQNRLGQRAESLATIAELIKSHPNSRYVTQAKQLEADVRRTTGQPVNPETQADEEMKLMALNALQHQDPERAVPMIEKLLAGNNPPKVKKRALFVLAQIDSPAARQLLAKIARGEGHPDLQRAAIQYLGIHGGRESRQLLEDIYKSTSDVDVKRRILQAFMVSGERARLLQVAQGETVPELRGEAVQQLGVMGAHDELWQLYTKESSRDVKKRILQAMFVGGNAERLIQLAKSESDPELRRVAVRNLGLMGSKRTGDALVEIYTTDKDPEIRKAVVQGLFIQNNAESLVAIARKENDPVMKREIVSKLSLMRSKAALDYLMEIIEK